MFMQSLALMCFLILFINVLWFVIFVSICLNFASFLKVLLFFWFPLCLPLHHTPFQWPVQPILKGWHNQNVASVYKQQFGAVIIYLHLLRYKEVVETLQISCLGFRRFAEVLTSWVHALMLFTILVTSIYLRNW